MEDEPQSVTETRTAVRQWLAEAWDTSLTVRQWWARLAESGWGFPQWPTEWSGRGLGPLEAAAVREELAAAGVIGPPDGAGPSMGANVLLAYGTEEQKARWLGPLARGEEHWCQFFSEPNAGSDLASVQCKAVLDGDRWIVNGQKVWNSGTLEAVRGLLVARTDPDLPKHRGMSFFIVDVDQPGVEIRPIRQMNGRTEFNETFFTDAEIAADGLVGGLNEGFRVAMATLTSERAAYAGGGESRFIRVMAGDKAGNLERTVADVLAEGGDGEVGGANTPPVHTHQQLTFHFPVQVIAEILGLPRADFPRFQRWAIEITSVTTDWDRGVAASEALRFTQLRAQEAARKGQDPGKETSIAYLGAVGIIRRYRDLAAAIAGPAATLMGPDAPDGGLVAMTVMTAPCHGIQGGSEQIQRNIIGEGLLGLPKEPQVDKDLPFREIRVSTAR